jgi:primosomal protein N' (replication factor Y)
MSYVNVIFNINSHKTYCYNIPDEMLQDVFPGKRVYAPFGNRELTGVIIEITEKAGYKGIKDIIDILDLNPLISKEMLILTQWMAEYYLAAWGQVIQLALPRGIEEFSKQIIFPRKDVDLDAVQLTEKQRYLLNIVDLEPGKTPIFYRQKFGYAGFYYHLHVLRKKRLIAIDYQRTGARVKKLYRRFVFTCQDFMDKIGEFRKRNELAEKLKPFIGKPTLYSDFKKDTHFSLPKIKRLIDKNIIKLESGEVIRKYQTEYHEQALKLKLTLEQERVLTSIKQTLEAGRFMVHLLHGITGSGKTQIYLDAIKFVLDRGKSAIVLIPEISLTPQTVARFENYFPGIIAVFHSKMSLGERYDVWRRVYNQELSIVIGPRSALFMPLTNVGIIIVDEEHDDSYKQNNSIPRYNARDVAIYRARMNNAVVILGSATPSVSSYYNACRGKYKLLELPSRISDASLPEVNLIDMKGISKTEGSSTIFSPLLIKKIQVCLERGEQIIILQNRRGHSSFLQCTDCGFIIRCRNCDIPLTYHKYNKTVQCHYCGYLETASAVCPKCRNEHIKYSGIGTQKVELELKSIFPGIRILRMDLDTTSEKMAHARILKQFKKGEADILMGTQMIAKGLDFPNVTLVGVISADIGLSFPDYRSAERTFQLLTQVAGRSGRGNKKGEVIIQSHFISHFAIRLAGNHDYTGFYNEEIKIRERLTYPPFCRLINIKIHANELTKAVSISREIGYILKKNSKALFEVVGPAPAQLSKIKNQYRWHLIIKINIKKDISGRRTKQIIYNKLGPYIHNKNKEYDVIIDTDPVEML